MNSAEARALKPGDFVSFKSDVEQVGVLVKVQWKPMCELILKSNQMEGFQGDYIGGDEFTTVMANDCWVE